MDNLDWLIILILLVVVLFFIFCIVIPTVRDEAIVHTTYEEGFEISHMETAGKHFIISARNDRDSFSIAVDSATYARFVIDDVIHVKVTVYEKDGHYTKGYEILGREGFVK